MACASGKNLSGIVIPVAPFTMDDADRMADEWGFSCGPAAISAITGVAPAEVRKYLGEYRGYMSPTDMHTALRRMRQGFTLSKPREGSVRWPEWGIVRIQWGGPWCAADVPVVARYKHTHWVAAVRDEKRGTCIFDVNAMDVGGWLLWSAWASHMVPAILEGLPRSDGRFWCTHVLELTRAASR